MTQTRLVPSVVVLVLASVALAGVAPAAGAAQESASFGENDVTVTRGGTVTVSVSHSAAANLTIGGDEEGFEVVVPLGGSGTDTVELDTYRTTSANPDDFLSVNGATLESSPLDEALEPGQYTMRVTIDGVTEAVGNIQVEPRAEATASAGVLPGSVDLGEAGAGDVFDRVTRRSEVAVGDYAALVVDANGTGLAGAFGDSPTTSSLAEEGFDFRVRELDPEPNTVAESYGGGDLTVLAQLDDRDRFAVLFDTGGVELGDRSNHTYGVRVTVDGETNPLFETDETLASGRVTLADPAVELDADPGFTLAPWDGAELRVNGTTNLAPTTTLDVRALQETSRRAEFWKDVVEVSANGTFAATFDFASAVRPGSFPLWVQGYRAVSERTVRLTAANASLLFPSQAVADGSVTVERLALSEGGFVRLTANGSTVGATGYLAAGTTGSVTVPLNESLDGPTNVTATAVVDADGDETLDADDPVYGASGEPVADTAVVRPAAEPTNDTSANATTTRRTTAAPATTDPPEATTIRVHDPEPLAPAASSGGGSDGFVPLSPVATFAAVGAAALLAARRSDRR
jgi:hypothetical protein